MKIHGDMHNFVFMAGIKDIVDNLFTGVNDSGDNFIPGVVVTSQKLITGVVNIGD
jgi:hypothetical protein